MGFNNQKKKSTTIKLRIQKYLEAALVVWILELVMCLNR